jgi:hypothetical protein
MVRTRGAIGPDAGTTAGRVDTGGVVFDRGPSAGPSLELKRRLGELVLGGRDDVVDSLVDRAAGSGDSLRLRRIAESAATTFCMKRGGIAGRVSLFIVAIVLVFDDEIPATQVDPLLRQMLLSQSIRSHIAAAVRTRDDDGISLLGEVFELDALARLPLSAIHRAAEAMSEGDLKHVRYVLGVGVDRPPRRSGAFLRFVVGQRTGVEGGAVTGERVLRSPARRIADAMRGTIDVPVRVGTCIDGSFFDGLFAGMWRYQDARIGQVARRAAERAGGGTLSARVETYGPVSCHGVGLSLHGERIDGSLCRCRIAGRPGAPIDETLHRVTEALRSASLRVIEQVRCDGSARAAGGGGCLCHGRLAFSVAI